MTDFSTEFKNGNKAFGTGEFEKSLLAFSRAHKMDPDHAVLNGNIAATLFELGQFEKSEIFAKRAIKLAPGYHMAHITLGMLYLLKEDFQNGWSEYEWVATLAEKFDKLPKEMQWNGESLAGAKVVVIDEQGYGDTIQFIRFTRKLIEMGAEVSLDIKSPLRRLVELNPQLGKVLHKGEKLEFSRWTRLLSIPRITDVSRNDLTTGSHYINAPSLPESSRINQSPGRKIGLIWKGSDANSRDAIRSLSPADFGPLFALSDIQFFHLHNLPFTEEIAAAGLSNRLIELHDEMNDFADLAAMIGAMDLVVTIDTAVAHLAGAMGKKTLCLLSYVPDWRWGRDSEKSLWYPNTTLYRQPARNDWATPIQEIVKTIVQEFHTPQ